MTLVQESRGIYSYYYFSPFFYTDIKEVAKNNGAIQVTRITVTCVNEVVK